MGCVQSHAIPACTHLHFVERLLHVQSYSLITWTVFSFPHGLWPCKNGMFLHACISMLHSDYLHVQSYSVDCMHGQGFLFRGLWPTLKMAYCISLYCTCILLYLCKSWRTFIPGIVFETAWIEFYIWLHDAVSIYSEYSLIEFVSLFKLACCISMHVVFVCMVPAFCSSLLWVMTHI